MKRGDLPGGRIVPSAVPSSVSWGWEQLSEHPRAGPRDTWSYFVKCPMQGVPSSQAASHTYLLAYLLTCLFAYLLFHRLLKGRQSSSLDHEPDVRELHFKSEMTTSVIKSS